MRPQKVGSYRQRVILYDIPESITDSYGQPSLAATIIGTFWAEVMQTTGQNREAVNIRQTWPTATHQVKLRWLGSMIPASTGNPAREILPRMKFVEVKTGDVLNIINATNVENRNWQWICICQEHQGATT